MILYFKQNFPEILKSEAEKILGTKLEIGERFESSDSFSFLLFNDFDKFVGKIYRFIDWPPAGKLEYLDNLLIKHQIPHEEILHISYEQPDFKYGWQLSRYIPGGIVRDLANTPNWNNADYFEKMGKILQQVHTIRFDYFGSLLDPAQQFKTFIEFAHHELEEQNFETVSTDFSWTKQIIDSAKNEIFMKLSQLPQKPAVLIHDDANSSNVLWRDGNPVLIDWADSLAGPAVRDFATMTFRQEQPVLQYIEKGYGQTIDQQELLIHQLMRFIRLAHFFYFEDEDFKEFEKNVRQLNLLLERKTPFGV